MTTSVQTDFVAKDEQMIAAFNRQQDRLDKLEKKLKEVGRASKQSSKESESGLGMVVGKLGGMAAGYLSVQAAISFTTQALADYHALQEQTAAAAKKHWGDLTKLVLRHGDALRGDEIENRLRNLSGATLEQGTQIFGGVSEASADQSLSRRLELTEAVAPLASLLGADSGFAQLVGELGDIFQDMSSRDVGDLAAKLWQRTEGKPGELASAGTLRAAKTLAGTGGVDQMTAFALMSTAGLGADLGAKTIEKLAVAIANPMAPGGKQLRGLSDEAKTALTEGTAEDRLRLALSDPQVSRLLGGDALAEKIKQIDLGAAEKLAEELRTAVGGDFLGEEMTRLTRTRAGGEAFREQEAAVFAERSRESQEARSAFNERINQQMGALLDTQSAGFFDWAARKATWSNFGMAGSMLENEETPAALRALRANVRTAELAGDRNEPMLQAMRELLGRMELQWMEVQKQTAAVQEQTEIMRQRPAVVGADRE